MNLKEQFQEASNTSKTFRKGSTDDKLNLYKYFKQATEGDVDISRPGIFNIEGRAKWDAWNAAKGLSKDEAMQHYIDAVAALGAKQ